MPWFFESIPYFAVFEKYPKFYHFCKDSKILNFIFKIMIWHMKRRGIPVVLFIPNTVKDLDLCLYLKPNAIMVDNPKFA